jgi:hypothetical protein
VSGELRATGHRDFPCGRFGNRRDAAVSDERFNEFFRQIFVYKEFPSVEKSRLETSRPIIPVN